MDDWIRLLFIFTYQSENKWMKRTTKTNIHVKFKVHLETTYLPNQLIQYSIYEEDFLEENIF